ncbi:metallophosphoesterase family protein [Tenacibaculum caenipelagi]|uniref:Icc protein n=1 Tax=Tenacibaculum caenipelagi TaxID=1325435 RepID=A0A4V3D3K9_9FLAO|nr:metallophosphoesterase [Tenacibaculum caenipelagi]TDQ30212.1 Icc protein [Tenacibaculum caenipelagi]
MLKRIAHITDLHLDEKFPEEHKISTRTRLRNVLQDILEQNITEIVCTGDIGESQSLEFFFNECNNFNLSITLGNHDSFEKVQKYLNHQKSKELNKLYYSQEKSHYKYIYLDSSSGQIDNNQLVWLKEELVSSTPIIIFIHHPILGLPLKVDEIGYLRNREDVLSLLSIQPNEITIFCGHYHLESFIPYKNIKQYITPAISFQIKKNSHTIEIGTETYGYRIIHINDHNISSKIQLLHDSN